MKKSEALKLAQFAVVSSPTIAPESKLEVLSYLMKDEEIACIIERMEEPENAETL